MDLTRLKSEITIGSNGLFLIFDKLGFLPTFYTAQDYLVAEGFVEQIKKIKGVTKLFPLELRIASPRTLRRFILIFCPILISVILINIRTIISDQSFPTASRKAPTTVAL